MACNNNGDTAAGGTPPDLTEILGDGEARAGKIVDEEALFGGISAEGRAGDYLIYNSRVRFVIQGSRQGDYYVQQGGVIDADIVRPEGEAGADLVDEWAGMYGLGRLADTQSVSVLDDGVSSGRAVICVEGPESPMGLLTGALESEDFIPDYGLWVRTVYTLEADSPLLEVTTTLTATEDDVAIEPGDILIGSLDLGQPWLPGSGLEGGDYPLDWAGFVGVRNDVALGILPAPGAQLELPGSISLLQELTDLVAGFGPEVEIPAGESVSYTRYYGVGADPAALSDAWLALNGAASEDFSGAVTAPDGPVAGARVNVLVDGEPWTLAFTDEDGSFSVKVPAGAAVSALASGRGSGLYVEHPEGAGAYSSYAAEPVMARSLEHLASGGPAPAVARGRGVADAADPLTLGAPATLVLSAEDGLPFSSRLLMLDEDGEVDPRLVQDRPVDGYAALSWSRDDTQTLEVEPGRYRVQLFRGQRFEILERDITLEAGQSETLRFELPAAYGAEGWLLGDLHVHSGPSNDANISIEDRAVVMAALGIQLLFGTDHDMVTDYRPVVEAAGLTPVMRAVVGDENSPVLRGHVNTYPMEPDPSQPNRGALLWWVDVPPDTQTWFDWLAERNPGVIRQLNHPLDSGVGAMAKWSPGVIGEPDRWTDDFEAVEVLNDGEYEDYLAFYLDVFHRGDLAAPVGVSDSHGHTRGSPGINGTFIHTGTGLDDYSDEALVGAMLDRATVVSLGPFIELSVLPGSTLTGSSLPATLEARALSPSWIVVDELALLENGVEVEVVAGDSARFVLDPAADASYSVVARGETPMGPLFTELPWAFTSPILVDLDGDGWDPPLPPLVMEP